MFEPVLKEILSSEAEYRAHPAYNYSKIKDWISKSPFGWRKRYVENDRSEDTLNEGIQDGSLIDVRLLGTEEEFEQKYFVGEVKMPKPQGVRFAQILMELTEQNLSPEGELQSDFTELFTKAYELAEIKTPGLPKWMNDFAGSDTEEYYQTLREAYGKTVVSFSKLEATDYTVKVLKTDATTGPIFNGEGFNQYPVVYEYEGETFKCLIDRLCVNHERKEIGGVDLKKTYAVADFPYQYLKLGYHLQDALYSKAVEAIRDANYRGYTILPFRYCVIDFPTFSRPLLWEFQYELENPWVGFTNKGRNYKGIWEILSEIKWAMKNDEWRIKKEHFELGGRVVHKFS
jgi:hypothetical protein